MSAFKRWVAKWRHNLYHDGLQGYGDGGCEHCAWDDWKRAMEFNSVMLEAHSRLFPPKAPQPKPPEDQF